MRSVAMMKSPEAEKKVMGTKMPVYWIVFSGLLCLESLGLLIGAFCPTHLWRFRVCCAP
jgi:hypothetical protein